jgi:ribosomal 30S subunit maturation factor RimM
VYVVKVDRKSSEEVLIPAIHDVVKKIDTENKEIQIEIIDGLL